MANEIVKSEGNSAVAQYMGGVDLGSILAEERDGLNLSFDRIKIPSGGGLAFEVPGENASTQWLEPVTDEEYDRLATPAQEDAR